MKILMGAMQLGANGIDSWIYNYFNFIEKSDLEFHFIIFDDKSNPGQYKSLVEEKGGIIHTVPTYSTNLIESYLSILKIMKQENFDLVHVHHDYMSSVMLLAAKSAGIKVRIAHAHTTKLPDSSKKYIYNIFKRLIPSLATQFMAPSIEAGMTIFGDKTVNSDKFYLIRNAIDPLVYTYSNIAQVELKKKLQLEDKIVIGIVGRLDKVKNHKFFINIAKDHRMQEFNFLIIGDGPLKETLNREVKDYPNITILSAKKDINKYYSLIDILLMPSLYEGIPLTLLEAQASGMKAIISENINKNSIVLDTTILLPLHLNLWINEILNYHEINRRNNSEIAKNNIKEFGYDIRTESKKLKLLYKNFVESRN